jgi:hypothetical protein
MQFRSGVSMRVMWSGLTACLLSFAIASAAEAASPTIAATDRQTQQEAVRSIPFNELTPETRAKIEGVVVSPSLYRRMPVEQIDCDPDLYLFLVRYPEVIVNIWKLMEITNVTVQRTGPFSVKTFDGANTNSHIELVYGTRDTHVIYGEGVYEGPLFKRKVIGRCVLVLRSGYGRGQDGRSKISNQLDMFVQIDNVGAEVIARTLHPMVGRTADLNFAESANFVERLSEAAETNAEAVQRLSDRLKDVEPTVREQFARLATVVAERGGIAAAEAASPATSAGVRTVGARGAE